YMLVLGVAVPATAFITYKLGIRGILALAMALVCVGAAVNYLAPDFPSALVGRVLQAVASGMVMPLVQTAAMVLFEPGKRATAMGVSGIAMGFAPNIGPTIGGAMVDAWGWRSFFLLLVVLAAVIAICSLAVVGKDMKLVGAEASAKLDLPSFVCSGLGFSGLLLAFSNASSFSILSPYCWAPLAVGIVFMVLFFVRQRRADYPLVSLRVFESPRYTVGLVCTVLLFASFMGVTLLIPLFIEDSRGGTALEAGLVLLPGTLAALVFNPVSGVLSDKVGVRKVVLAGGILLVAGACAAVLFTESTPLALVAVLQGVRASGVSLLMAALFSWSLSELDPGILSGGSAFAIMARQAAASFGTALMVMGTQLGPMIGLGDAFGYGLAFGISALCAIAMLVLAFARVR
ncbi:MAG: MFS transporter, partial [Eggerthellaceae bacterium]|nr:MFS transporter [Eggerthellaceae bacterium]